VRLKPGRTPTLGKIYRAFLGAKWCLFLLYYSNAYAERRAWLVAQYGMLGLPEDSAGTGKQTAAES